MDKVIKRQIVESFLKFAEERGAVLGGDVIYGFAMEYTEFRPMAKQDYPLLISDFLKKED